MTKLVLLALSVIGVGASSVYVREVRPDKLKITIAYSIIRVCDHRMAAGISRRNKSGNPLVLPMTVIVTGHVLVVPPEKKKTELPTGDVHRGFRGR